MKNTTIVLLLSLVLVSCVSKQESVIKIIEQSGKIEITLKGKKWQTIKSTGSAAILVKDEDGIEQAMNVATLRAKANIIEFLNSEISSNRKTESSLSSSLQEKQLTQKVLETIYQEAKGNIKYSYVVEREIKQDYAKVVVVLNKNISELSINLSN
jgi:hypothetical protein